MATGEERREARWGGSRGKEVSFFVAMYPTLIDNTHTHTTDSDVWTRMCKGKIHTTQNTHTHIQQIPQK